MNEIEICTTAIETNVRTLIKMHPDPKRFMETLRNEAIDQAFREISESIETLAERIQYECASKLDILNVLHLDSRLKILEDNFNGLSEDIDETVMPKIDKQNNRISTLEKHVEFLEKRTHHLIPKLEE